MLLYDYSVIDATQIKWLTQITFPDPEAQVERRGHAPELLNQRSCPFPECHPMYMVSGYIWQRLSVQNTGPSENSHQYMNDKTC